MHRVTGSQRGHKPVPIALRGQSPTIYVLRFSLAPLNTPSVRTMEDGSFRKQVEL